MHHPSNSNNQPSYSPADMPLAPTPRRRSLRQWYHAQTKRTKIGLYCSTLLAVLLLLCSCEDALTTTDVTTPTPVPTSTQRALTSSPGATTRATLTSTPIQPGATHGRPRLGGPFSDFVGKYGQPTDTGSFTDGHINIGPQTDKNNIVQDVTAAFCDSCSDSWSLYQSRDYCLQFMPSDAVSYKGNDQNLQDLINSPIYFKSSIGIIGLTVNVVYCTVWIDNSN